MSLDATLRLLTKASGLTAADLAGPLDGRTVADHFGAVQDHEEEASAVPPRKPRLQINAPMADA